VITRKFFPHEFSYWIPILFLTLLAILGRSAKAQDPSSDQTSPATSSTAQDAGAAANSDAAVSDGGTMAAAGSPLPTDTSPLSISSLPTGDIQKFQTDLFTGRFSFPIPIIVPPGRGNSQPNIALAYNSAGGNGWCGVGWMLDMG
jgi:hypothetical protein